MNNPYTKIMNPFDRMYSEITGLPYPVSASATPPTPPTPPEPVHNLFEYNEAGWDGNADNTFKMVGTGLIPDEKLEQINNYISQGYTISLFVVQPTVGQTAEGNNIITTTVSEYTINENIVDFIIYATTLDAQRAINDGTVMDDMKLTLGVVFNNGQPPIVFFDTWNLDPNFQ